MTPTIESNENELIFKVEAEHRVLLLVYQTDQKHDAFFDYTTNINLSMAQEIFK